MCVEFELPRAIIDFYGAFQTMQDQMAHPHLEFTLDGRLLGDIAEALVAQHFDLTFPDRRVPGVDAYKGQTTVQIKATQFENKGPSFSPGNGVAHHLIFVWLDFPGEKMRVVYNGPEPMIRQLLPQQLNTTRTVSRTRVAELNSEVRDADRITCVCKHA